MGFLLGAGGSLAGGCDWSTALWRACAAALAAAILVRWWSNAWMAGLHDAIKNAGMSVPLRPLKPKPLGKYESRNL